MKNRFSLNSIMKKIAPVLMASLFLLPLSARAEVKAGSVEVTPFGGVNFFENRQNLKNEPLVGGRLGYNITNHIGIEGTWDFMKSYVDDKSLRFTREGQFTSPKDSVYITQYQLGLLYHFMPESVFNPYITAGYGIIHYTPKINNKNLSVVTAGLGAKYWLSEHVALRADVRENLILDETVSNVETTLGVVFAFGGKSVVAKPLDSDGDGVINTLDKCPNTPSGVAVDKDGCPLDADKDGVPDYLDKCPDTPAGVAVDRNGCPLDADKDGVPDYLDKCPGTPAGVAVDRDGCPLDTDGDGVPDYLDKCPDTPAGVKVDANGCPPVVVVPVSVPVHVKEAAAKRFCSKPAILEIHFDFDKSDIKPEYHEELKTVGDFLVYFPNAKGEISGHTDSIAGYEYNQKLSERRAEAVEKYISANFGINPGRITTKGYGETRPIASNMEEAGRKMNRRIEANFTCE